MRLRRSLALVMGLFLVLTMQGVGQSAPQGKRPTLRSEKAGLPDGFLPAAVRARQLGRYFVEMRAPAVADAVLRSSASTSTPQKLAASAALRAQDSAIAQAKSLGGAVVPLQGAGERILRATPRKPRRRWRSALTFGPSSRSRSCGST